MPSLRVVYLRVLVAAGLVLAPGALSIASAQDADTLVEPAHISYVDGAATMERDGETEAIAVNTPVVAGDRLRTNAGRIEVLFPDGSALDVDEYSSVDILSPTLVRLVAGRAMLAVFGANTPAAAVRYRVDTPVASVRIETPGEFRISVMSDGGADQTELAVMRGAATFATERGALLLRSGERSMAIDDRAPSGPQAFNSARFDEFDRWYAGRRSARATPLSTTSAQYLPADLRAYSGALDRNGSWQYTAPYGYVWYPSVAADWQPYYYGSWSSVPSYGWTWVGVDVWSWPTHHYGRWGYGRGSWFWIPGRRWSTAWVSWASAPGYVSWCPLGFDGQPVFGLSTGFVSPYRGWVVVQRSSFGARSFYASRHAIPSQRLPRSTPFAVHTAAPVPAVRSATRAAVANAPPSTAVSRVGRSPDAVNSSPGRRTPHDGGGLASRDQAPSAPRPNGADAGAQREFKRPLPETFRGPSVDRSTAAGQSPAVPPQAVPRAPDTATPRYAYPPSPTMRAPVEDSRYRHVPAPETPNGSASPRSPAAPSPAPPAPSAQPAVPRGTPPTREMRQPSTSPPPPTPPASAPARQPHASGESAPAHSAERAPQSSRPSSGSAGSGDSRAVPRDQGSHQGGERRR